jgi:hypothetical protein
MKSYEIKCGSNGFARTLTLTLMVQSVIVHRGNSEAECGQYDKNGYQSHEPKTAALTLLS